jgi:phage tail P2-like protein
MSLLPPNTSPIERAVDAATARLSDVPVPLRTLANPDTCTLALLPYLAWALSIDTWDSDWPEAVMRNRVRQAIDIQRRKGTASSVRDVVASFGGSLALREWWQMAPAGDPHTFAIVLALEGIVPPARKAAYVDAVIAEIRRTKPVRSHFTFTQALSATGGLQIAAAARPAILARLTLSA